MITVVSNRRLVAVVACFAWALTALAGQTGAQTPASNPADLNPLINHYKGLKNITYTIVHHGDVGPVDKEIAERVYWTKGRFEITPIAYGPDPAADLPRLVANNGDVNTLTSDGELKSSPLDPGPGSIGVWEARGGLLLVWLMDGKTWKRMVEAQENVLTKFSVGEAKTWRDHPVREIVLTHTAGTYRDSYSIFVSPDGQSLVGAQWKMGQNTVWTEFAEQSETP